MINAAAVLIYLPSPNGFLGIGDLSNVIDGVVVGVEVGFAATAEVCREDIVRKRVEEGTGLCQRGEVG